MAQTEASEVGQKLSPGLKIYLGVLGLVGAGVILAGYLLGWGFWGWFGGGLLVFAGWGSLLGNRFKVGWQPAVGPCPQCGERLHFLTKKQYVRCAGCDALLRVVGQRLTTVSGQIVSDTPEYPAPFVRGASFPAMCMLCGAPATTSETVRFDSRQQKVGVPGLGIVEVTKLAIDVPTCADHAGKKAVALDYGGHTSTQHAGVSVKFRSVAALEAYRKHNAAVLPPVVNEPQMVHAPSA